MQQQLRDKGGLRVPGAPIKLVGARKNYGDLCVLRDLDLEVAPGEFMTLLGPSGSGKTTTLGLIAGFTDLSDGSLEVDGKNVRYVPMHKRGIGVVFQNYALFPHMTVAQNVAFPLRQRGISRKDARGQVDEALKTVHMTEYGGRFPSELSGGQQQRVALARSIVFKPRVLLMDEPLGALDKKLRDSLQLEIRRIHSEVGSTFVYVTHDQDEALSMSDRIAVFNQGRIEQVGTPAELYDSPQTLFVGEFIGESTTLRGVVSGANPQTLSVTGAGHWRAPRRGQFREGDNVSLLVRPEHIRLIDADADTPRGDANRASVTVEDFIYMGTDYKCKFRLADGCEGVARIPGLAGLDVAIGQNALIEWDTERGVVLEAAA
jgi:putative spermidine/putrescine transport system ATP-binding protein